MKLAFVKAAGFRGIRNTLEIDISPGFLVLTGPNGSGKSTFFDTIEFALTGALSKYGVSSERSETVEQYLWWRGPGTASQRYVSVGLVGEDGRILTITRTPGGLQGVSEDELQEALCQKGASPDAALVQLSRTSIVRDEMITAWSVDLPETDRFNFVNSAIGSVDLSRLERKLSEVVRALHQESEETTERSEEARRQLNIQVALLSEQRARAKSAESALEAERALRHLLGGPEGPLLELLRHAERERVNARLRIERISRTLERLMELEAKAAAIASSAIRERYRLAEQAVEDARRALARVRLQLKEANTQLTHATANQGGLVDLSELRQRGMRVGLRDGRCPLCGSEVSREAFERHLRLLQDVVEKGNLALNALTATRVRLNQEEQAAIQRLEEAEKQQAEAALEQSLLRQERERVSRELHELGLAQLNGREDVKEQIRGTIEMLRTNFAELERLVATIESSQALEGLSQMEVEISRVQEEVNSLERRIARLTATEAQVKSALEMVSRTSKEIVDERLSALMPLLAELYGRLRPHVDWPTVDYQMRGSIRRFLSFRVGEGRNPRFMFSSGQRRAAGLAFLLAVHLSRTWCRLETLCLDDPVQHVDDFRALHLVEVLAAIRRRRQQIVCAVEDAALAELLCRRMRSESGHEGMLVTMAYQAGEGVRIAERRPVRAFAQAVLASA